MLIIAGLGNPGSQYAGNRHNIGFMAVDAIHARHGFPLWRKKFQAEVSEGTIAGTRVLLMKPQTYMNESGRAVGEAMHFLKLQPAEVVVLHDDLDLVPGKLRVKTGGGHGGHNGLRSITSQITDGYKRIRLGIGHPGDKSLVHAHVLSDFFKVDRDWLQPLLDAVADNIGEIVAGNDATFANRVHLATSPEKPAHTTRTPRAEAAPAAAPTQTEGGAPKTDAPEKNAMAAVLKSLLAQKRRK